MHKLNNNYTKSHRFSIDGFSLCFHCALSRHHESVVLQWTICQNGRSNGNFYKTSQRDYQNEISVGERSSLSRTNRSLISGRGSRNGNGASFLPSIPPKSEKFLLHPMERNLSYLNLAAALGMGIHLILLKLSWQCRFLLWYHRFQSRRSQHDRSLWMDSNLQKKIFHPASKMGQYMELSVAAKGKTLTPLSSTRDRVCWFQNNWAVAWKNFRLTASSSPADICLGSVVVKHGAGYIVICFLAPCGTVVFARRTSCLVDLYIL